MIRIFLVLFVFSELSLSASNSLNDLYFKCKESVNKSCKVESLDILIAEKDALVLKVKGRYTTTLEFHQNIESEKKRIENKILLLIRTEIKTNGAGKATLKADTKEKIYYDADKGLMELSLTWNKELNKLLSINKLTKIVSLKIKAKDAKKIFKHKAKHRFYIDIYYDTHQVKLRQMYLKDKEDKYIFSSLDSTTKELGLNSFNGFAKVARGQRSYSTIKGKPNIIQDNLRGLLWEREDDGNKKPHDEAIKYCKNLELDGIKGWRLPTMEELYYLADRSKRNPSIDENYFKNTQKDWYWTSTKKKDTSASFWVVYFYDGDGDWGNDRYFVRCVRQ